MARRHTRKRRVSRRSRSCKNSVRYHQKAGGNWQSFCVACGKPLSNWSLDREPYNKPVAETEWMNRNVGFDSEHALILELGADDMLGATPILHEQHPEMNDVLGYMSSEEGGNFNVREFHIHGDDADYDPETQLGGIVIHKACERRLQKSGINVNFDLVAKLEHGCRANKQYQEQEYDWTAALAADPNHHKSPIKSKSSAHQLIFGCARDVPDMREATEVREEMARRQRVVNLKRYTNVTRKMNGNNAARQLPLNIKTQIGSYLASPSNERRATGNVVATGALGGAGNGRAPPSVLENVD